MSYDQNNGNDMSFALFASLWVEVNTHLAPFYSGMGVG